MDNVLDYIINVRNGAALLIVITIIVVIRIGNRIYNRFLKRMESRSTLFEKSNKRTAQSIGKLVKIIIIVIGVMLLLQLYGVNISSLITSLGLASAILGLALQDILKDFINGFYIISGNYFKIGDVIRIDSIEGEVIDFNLKNTTIRDTATNNIYTVANRNIDKTLNVSKNLYLNYSVGYDISKTKINKIFDIVVEESKNIEGIESIKFLGINEFAESAIVCRVAIECDPKNKYAIKRAVNGVVKEMFDKYKVEIPFNQLDIHQK